MTRISPRSSRLSMCNSLRRIPVVASIQSMDARRLPMRVFRGQRTSSCLKADSSRKGLRTLGRRGGLILDTGLASTISQSTILTNQAWRARRQVWMLLAERPRSFMSPRCPATSKDVTPAGDMG